MTMSKRKQLLYIRARRKSGRIEPVCGNASHTQSFTYVNGSMVFWYNDRNGSTHIVKEQKGNE